MIHIKRLASSDGNFEQSLDALLSFETSHNTEIDQTVTQILKEVQKRGDDALLDYTQQFDKLNATSVDQLELPREHWQNALQALEARQRDALEQAACRIRTYHEKQLSESWHYTESDGTLLGQKVTDRKSVV